MSNTKNAKLKSYISKLCSWVAEGGLLYAHLCIAFAFLLGAVLWDSINSGIWIGAIQQVFGTLYGVWGLLTMRTDLQEPSFQELFLGWWRRRPVYGEPVEEVIQGAIETTVANQVGIAWGYSLPDTIDGKVDWLINQNRKLSDDLRSLKDAHRKLDYKVVKHQLKTKLDLQKSEVAITVDLTKKLTKDVFKSVLGLLHILAGLLLSTFV